MALINETNSDVTYTFAGLGLPEECMDLQEDRKYNLELTVPSHDAVLLIGKS